MSDAHEPRLQLRSGERSTPDFRITFDELGFVTYALQYRSRTPLNAVGILREHPQHRDFSARRRVIAVQRQRRFEGCQRQLVGAHRARYGVGAAGRDRLLRTHEYAGLRSPQQLVAAEDDQIGARGHPFGNGRLPAETPGGEVDQQPAAEVVDAREPAPVRHFRELDDGDIGGKACHLKV